MKGAPIEVPLFSYASTDIMSIGAEGRIRTRPSRPVLSRLDPASIVAETPDHVPLIYPLTPVCIAKYKVSPCDSTPPSRVSWAGCGRGTLRFRDDVPLAM